MPLITATQARTINTAYTQTVEYSEAQFGIDYGYIFNTVEYQARTGRTGLYLKMSPSTFERVRPFFLKYGYRLIEGYYNTNVPADSGLTVDHYLEIGNVYTLSWSIGSLTSWSPKQFISGGGSNSKGLINTLRTANVSGFAAANFSSLLSLSSGSG